MRHRLLLGLSSGARVLLRLHYWRGQPWRIAAVIGLAILGICIWANAIGALVPLLAKRFGIDPALVSAPLISTLVDATGLFIFYSIAIVLLIKLNSDALARPPMRFAEMTAPEIRALPRATTLVVAPIAACEQHSRHLPVFTDSILAAAVADGVERTLPDRVLLLPRSGSARASTTCPSAARSRRRCRPTSRCSSSCSPPCSATASAGSCS